MCLAFRYCLHCCTLLSNQDTIIKNSYCLTASLIQYLFTHVVPLRKKKEEDFSIKLYKAGGNAGEQMLVCNYC